MAGIIHFKVFLLAGILLNLTPGNDTIFILTKSIGQGKRAGIVSALGIGTGSLIHTLLAAFGFSIIITRSVLLFHTIKYLGAFYLVYLGYKMLTGKSRLNEEGTITGASENLLKIYRDAILTNVLNPKVALFFISFLPQFIIPTQKSTVLPFLTLGMTFIITGTTWCLVLAFFAANIFARLKHNAKTAAYINRACGLALIGIGIKVALENKP